MGVLEWASSARGCPIGLAKTFQSVLQSEALPIPPTLISFHQAHHGLKVFPPAIYTCLLFILCRYFPSKASKPSNQVSVSVFFENPNLNRAHHWPSDMFPSSFLSQHLSYSNWGVLVSDFSVCWACGRDLAYRFHVVKSKWNLGWSFQEGVMASTCSPACDREALSRCQLESQEHSCLQDRTQRHSPPSCKGKKPRCMLLLASWRRIKLQINSNLC